MSYEVPRTWGESDSPLLPKELQRPLERLNLIFTIERKTKGRTKKVHNSYATLASNFKWRSLLNSEELLQTLENLAPHLRGENYERWLDFPALPKFQKGHNFDVTDLALLRHTHLVLKERKVDLKNLNEHIQFGSFLTILNLTDNFVATLDLVITARNFLESSINYERPETLDEVLSQLTYCILLEHGLERESKKLESLLTIAASRLGFHQDGMHTLQAISDSVGVTRERIRQIVQQATPVNAQLDRVWPPAPIVHSALLQISLRKSWDDEQLGALLDTEFHTHWKSPCQTMTKILSKLEVEPSHALLNESELVSIDDARAKFVFPTKTEVRRSVLHTGGMSCFSLIDDVVDDLASIFPDIPEEDLRATIRDNAIYGNLPLNYVFASGHRISISPVSRALLMLAWAGELSIDEIRIGLDRYGRFRKLPPPPPNEVLQAFYELRPEFEVTGDLVRASIPTNRGEDTVEGKIALLCEQQDGAVISKTLIHDHFRQLGRYTSSASLCITYSPLLRPAGKGCITIVGRKPTSNQIEAARELSRHLTIDSNVTWTSTPTNQTVEILVGTVFRDSGVITLSSQKARWLEGRRLRVFSEEMNEHGSLSVSGNFLYGFTPFLNAMRIDAGDTIQVEIDTKGELVLIRVNQVVLDF